jgi:uncharacterized protein (DUF39 family)
MAKTIAEINDRIRKGEAVVVTAEEMIGVVEEKGPKKAAEKVDVVTTGTFSPMCSSGMVLSIGHPTPRIKLGGGTCYLNDVPAHCGLAAIDIYVGASSLPEHDPRNRRHPGKFRYGGGHLIHDFVAGKDVRLSANACGTDCYPRKRLSTWIRINDVNEAFLFNPRNSYQNYNVAVNLSANKKIYTYMGMLKPRLGNANYSSAGQLSPLLNDPLYRTIGVGTRIFLAGGVGYVAWHGTQYNPSAERKANNVPCRPGGSLATIGDLKQMRPEWLVGASFPGVGVTMYVGVGIPIPVLDEEMAGQTAVKDQDIFAPVVDYGHAYPQHTDEVLGEVSYAQLRSGLITVRGRQVPVASLSSYPKAIEISQTLKEWIQRGRFLLTEPVAPLPGPEAGIVYKPLEIRPIRKGRKKRK